mgnify:CR=1 FL=1|jgi:hypothetical protein
MKPRDIGLVSRQTECFIIIALIVAAVVGAISYARNYAKNSTMESFGGKLMFHGSYPKAPVVCLAGSSKIPCTAFSGA